MPGNRRPGLGWTLANVIAAVLFAASVAVQINDPDPLPWMAIYGGAATIALLECTRRVRPVFPALLSVTALGWAATIAPRVIGKVPFAEMFGGFEMKNVGVEESREMYGLLLVAVWMAAVALAGWRRGKLPGPPPVRPPAVLLLALAAGITGCDYDAKELSYDPAIGHDGTFFFYEPKSDTARTHRPAIVAIHGGGFRAGDKAWGDQFAKEFCPRGYVVFSINYRLTTRPNGKWPAQIEDVQKALRYIRANADRFRIDPARIASLGVSAGGHLATMVALRDDPAGPDGRVRVAVNIDGQSDLTLPHAQDFTELLTNVLGHPAPWSDAELRDISTVTFARPDVSVLTIHGAGDDDVGVDQGDRLNAALRANGADTEFIRLEGKEGRCHTDCWKVQRGREAMHRFLARKLGT